MMGTVADITENKRAEQRLKESEAKFSGIVSISADAIISIDDRAANHHLQQWCGADLWVLEGGGDRDSSGLSHSRAVSHDPSSARRDVCGRRCDGPPHGGAAARLRVCARTVKSSRQRRRSQSCKSARRHCSRWRFAISPSASASRKNSRLPTHPSTPSSKTFPSCCSSRRASRCGSCGSIAQVKTCSVGRGRAFIGKNDYDLWPQEQAEFFVEKDRETLKSGKIVDITGRTDPNAPSRRSHPAHEKGSDPRRGG